MSRQVDLYDSTLRDGTQRASVSLSVDDKLKILSRLDALGVAYIEGGWPGSNPKDAEFFSRAADVVLTTSTLTAFGMTRRPGGDPATDPQLAEILASRVKVACIVGKASVSQVTDAIGTTLDENLAMVADSIAYLRQGGLRVFFDAEHFFDGYREDRIYAIEVLDAARQAGAEIVILCDTNGGTLPHAVGRICRDVAAKGHPIFGGHFHDDSGCGVANTLAAVVAGAVQVQGCVNGYGERCGNADILAVAADLSLKMDVRCLPDGKLAEITEVSRFVSEVANLPVERHRAFVGDAAFAHKGGLHVSAVMKDPSSYEHIDPSAVGNSRAVLTSDLSGAATLRAKAATLGIDMDAAQIADALGRLKRLEHDGYSFEAAEASLELLLRKSCGWEQGYFEPIGFRTIVEEESGHSDPPAEATVRILVGGERVVAVAEGDGPVDALDKALRSALEPAYPGLLQMHLSDYKVRVLDPQAAAAARVRVLVETTGPSGTWSSVGVSTNIIEASYRALLDSVVVGLLRSGADIASEAEAVAGFTPAAIR